MQWKRKLNIDYPTSSFPYLESSLHKSRKMTSIQWISLIQLTVLANLGETKPDSILSHFWLSKLKSNLMKMRKIGKMTWLTWEFKQTTPIRTAWTISGHLARQKTARTLTKVTIFHSITDDEIQNLCNSKCLSMERLLLEYPKKSFSSKLLPA